MSLATTAKGVALIGSVIYEFTGALSINPHCLSTKNDKGYGGIWCIKQACIQVKAARVVVITAVTDYAT